MGEQPKTCPHCGWGTIIDGGIFKHRCDGECDGCEDCEDITSNTGVPLW